MLVKEYISEGGAHIKVYDDFIDDSPENRERIYNNLSRIVTGIMLRQYDEDRMVNMCQNLTPGGGEGGEELQAATSAGKGRNKYRTD